MTAHLQGGVTRLSGSPLVRLWDREMSFFQALDIAARPLWSADAMLHHRAGHPAWVRTTIMDNNEVTTAWDTMVADVYDGMQGQGLPDKKILDRSRQLVLGAWVRFTSRNSLRRYGLTTMSGQTLGFGATARMPKAKSSVAGRRGKGGGAGGGDVPRQRSDVRRGRMELLFTMTHTVLVACGVELVWAHDHLEVLRVDPKVMEEAGWKGGEQGTRLQPGDVVKKVNGTKVIADTAKAATAFMEAQRHFHPFTLFVERDSHKAFTLTNGDPIPVDLWSLQPQQSRGRRRVFLQRISDEGDDGLGDDEEGMQQLAKAATKAGSGAGSGAGRGSGKRGRVGGDDSDDGEDEGAMDTRSRGRGATARSKQLRGAHTDKVLYGTIKTAVVGRQRYKGTAVNWLDCINIERNKDWDEAKMFPDAARVTTIKGTIGYIAADYHLKLLAHLVDNTAQYHCEVEIDDGEGCINNEYVLDVKIKVG